MPIRLLLYVPGLEEGGSEKRVERLVCGLPRDCFEATVAYSNCWGIVGDRLLAAGIRVVRLPSDDAAEAARVIVDSGPDIFHSFAHKDNVDIAAAHTAGVPVIAGSRVNVREWDDDMRVRDWERGRNRVTHYITAVSQAAAEVCSSVEGIPLRSIFVLHSGVPITTVNGCSFTVRDELELSPGTQTIGYVANYRPEKDHDTLLRAFARIIDRLPNTHLICCGIATPEMRSGLLALAAQLEIESKVSLLESRQDLRGVYRGLDLYVHPSRFEGFSNSLLEAMAEGLPVVAVNAGGTCEAVLDGVTGLLTPRGDPLALGDALITLLTDAQRLKEFGCAGRKRAERYFSLEKMLHRYTEFYEWIARSPEQRIVRSKRTVEQH